MANKVEVWRTYDGTLFDSEDLANVYEQKLDFINYFNDHPIYGGAAGCRIDGEDVIAWMEENPRIAIFLLPEENEDG